MNLAEKETRLCNILKSLESVVVAFSGGVDSTYLLLKATEVLRGNALGVTGDFPASPEREIREAMALSEQFHLNHTVLRFNPLNNDKVRHNVNERCYYCKHEIFSQLIQFAEKKGFQHVADGTNASDSPVERPGMRALKELGIISPLREAGLTKEDIRELSRQENLPTWNMPSSPCLMTRFPFNRTVSESELFQVEKAEDILKTMGFTDFRVRYYESIARIEFLEREMADALDKKQEIARRLKEAGFSFVTMDLDGLRSGSMG